MLQKVPRICWSCSDLPWHVSLQVHGENIGISEVIIKNYKFCMKKVRGPSKSNKEDSANPPDMALPSSFQGLSPKQESHGAAKILKLNRIGLPVQKIQTGHRLQMIPTGDAVQPMVKMDLYASRSIWITLRGLADRNVLSI